MLIEILDLIRNWSAWAQVISLLFVSFFCTLIVLATLSALGDFFTLGLPSIIWGWPKSNEKTSAKDEKEEN